MPGRGTPPSRLPVRDLWFGIFAFPTFGGFLLGVPLVGTPTSGEWARFWAVLVIGGFLAVWATVPNVVYLSELARRRVWVPPGTARHPILVASALTVLLLAAGVAIDFVGIWVTELAFGLAMPAWLIGAFIGGLVGALFVSFDRIGRRLARKPPVSEGNGSTETRLPADRPREEA
jgi:hypothetical protein